MGQIDVPYGGFLCAIFGLIAMFGTVATILFRHRKVVKPRFLAWYFVIFVPTWGILVTTAEMGKFSVDQRMRAYIDSPQPHVLIVTRIRDESLTPVDPNDKGRPLGDSPEDVADGLRTLNTAWHYFPNHEHYTDGWLIECGDHDGSLNPPAQINCVYEDGPRLTTTTGCVRGCRIFW